MSEDKTPEKKDEGGELVQWQPWTPQQAQQEAAQIKKSRRGKYIRPDGGKNKYRMLPPLTPKGPARLLHRHFVKGSGQKAKMINCARKAAGEECVVCNRASALAKSDSEADRKAAEDLWPQTKAVINVVDLHADTSQVHILELPPRVWQEICEKAADEDTGGDIADPRNGYPILIVREGQGLNTTYTVGIGKKPISLPDESVIKEQYDLDYEVSAPSPSRVREINNLMGPAPATTIDTEAEESGGDPASGAKPAGSGSGIQADLDQQVAEADVDDDDFSDLE